VGWTFLYDETRALYSHTGQPSLDPVVFFKLVLVGQLKNLVSDRRLGEHCALRLNILLFLGYEIDEELPGHSTVTAHTGFSQRRSLSFHLTTSLP
jgi:transposase